MGILAAALHRERTGEGQHVQVNLMSTAVAALANQASSYLATGVAPGRLGNRHPSIAPYETVRCRDGHLALAVANDRQWRALIEMLGRYAPTPDGPARLRDPRFATNPGRVEHHDEMLAALEAVMSQDDVSAWLPRLRGIGVPAGKVNDVAEALALAASFGLEPVQDVGAAHPPQVRHPVRYSAFDPVPPVAPPALDQHGASVREWLRTPRE